MTFNSAIKSNFTLKTFVAVASAISLFLTLAAPVQSASALSPSRTLFTSCSKLNHRYPSGIAVSDAAARVATSKGYLKPLSNSAVYRTNKKKLDPKKLGFVCLRKGKPNLGSVSVKTPWGYLKSKQVYAPAADKCVGVSAQLDIRNMSLVPYFGLNVTIRDEFSNLVAYEEWSPAANEGSGDFVKLPNGIYTVPLKVCSYGHAWTHSSGSSGETLSAWQPKTEYMLEVWEWLSGSLVSASTITFP